MQIADVVNEVIAEVTRRGLLSHAAEVKPAPPPIKPISVEAKNAAALTGLPLATIYNLITAGKLQTTQIGRRKLIHFDSLETLLK